MSVTDKTIAVSNADQYFTSYPTNTVDSRLLDANIPASPATYYQLHSLNGNELKDSYGNGTDLVVTTSGTPFAQGDWYAPDNSVTDDYLQILGDEYLADIFDFDVRQEVQIYLDIDFTADPTTLETIFFYGKGDDGGGIGLGLSSNGQLEFLFKQASAGSFIKTATIVGIDLTGVTGRLAIALSLRPETNGLFTYDISIFDGIPDSDNRFTSSDTGIDLSDGTGLYISKSVTTKALTIAGANGASAVNNRLNEFGSGAKIQNLRFISPDIFNPIPIAESAAQIFDQQHYTPDEMTVI